MEHDEATRKVWDRPIKIDEDNGFGSIVGERTLCYAEGREFDPTWRRRDFTNLDI